MPSVPKVKKKSDESSEPKFEESLEKIEAIVADLEEGQIGLSETLARYEEGIGLLKQCYRILERAEQRIELISDVDSQGNPIGEPFDTEGSASLEEKAARRTTRRTHRSKKGRSKSDSADDSSTMDEAGDLF